MRKTYYIQGMHCASCKSIVRELLEKNKNIKQVTFYGNKITIESKKEIPLHKLQRELQGSEYTIGLQSRIGWNDIGIGVIVVIVVYSIMRILAIDQYMQLEHISIIAALVMGLSASLSSCMAITGALILSISTKAKNIHAFTITFNTVRIATYIILGAALGYVGSFLTINTTINGIITALIAILMIFIALQMIGVIPPLFQQTFKPSTKSATGLGIVSFFIPCGFTQIVQLYVISTANPLTGALLMGAFSIGTLPALVGIGYLPKLFSDTYKQRIHTIIGVIILSISFTLIIPALTFLGISLPSTTPLQEQQVVPIIDGVQVVHMDIIRLDYVPHQFVIQKDIPVRWEIDASMAVGCARVLQVPKLNMQEVLPSGKTVIEFTPTQAQELPFHCGMAMTTPNAKFIVQ